MSGIYLLKLAPKTYPDFNYFRWLPQNLLGPRVSVASPMPWEYFLPRYWDVSVCYPKCLKAIWLLPLEPWLRGQPQPQWHRAPELWFGMPRTIKRPKCFCLHPSWLCSSCGTNFNLLQNLFLENSGVFRRGFLEEETGAGIHITWKPGQQLAL